jgi:signal transduction histidine kinase/ligand-binding sensor domain-containing protein/CheY-like chemotaxis protein
MTRGVLPVTCRLTVGMAVRLPVSVRVLVALCALFVVPSHALADHHLQVDTWTVASGLPQDTVTGLAQDTRGYLWVATRKGLARFDGLQFRPVGVVDGFDLSTLRLTAVVADDAGGVWVGTYATGLLHLKDGQLRRYGQDDGIPPGTIWDVRRDPAGRIWVATPGGARYLAEGRWLTPEVPESLSDSANTAVADRAARVWIGTSTRGVVRIDAEGARAFGIEAGLPGARVFSIVEDRRGTIWAGTPDGVARFDEDSQQFEAIAALRDTAAYQLLVDRHDDLWIATYGRGLLHYDVETAQVSRAEGLASDFVLSLLEDREGTVWAGTVSGGMSRLVPVARELLDTRAGLPNFPVTTVYQDRFGAYWVGTLGGGLVRIEDGVVRRFTGADGLPSDSITSVAGGPGSSVWVGTSGAGAFRFEDGRVVERLRPGRVGSIVRTVEFDGHSTFVGGRGLLAIRPDGTERRWSRADGLGSDDVRVLYSTPRGMFIGTFGGGLSLLTPDGTLTTWGAAQGLDNPYVTSVHVDDHHEPYTVWIGTYGGGLYRLRTNRLERIDEAHGLEDNVVFDIMEDDQARLWLMMNQGISVVAIADANRVADGLAPVLPSAFLGSAQGISGIDGTDGNQPQSWLATDGRIWFATTRGVVIVDPSTVQPPTVQPAVWLDSLEVNDAPVAMAAAGLSLTGRDLRLEFSAPQLLSGSRVRYQHRLVGYDEGWSPPGDARTASYTNLPPGAYRFEVRAQAWRGAPFGQPATLTFEILPRYYETRWFTGLMSVVAAGVLFGAYTLRVRRMRQRERTLQQLVDTRTAALRHEMSERDRAERERRALDERVQQAQRLESLGMLAGGIAHDFNNLLVGVLGEAGLALMDVPAGSRVRAHLQRIEQAALQASELTSQMLAYSGRGRFVQAPVYLPDIVRDTARLLTTVLGREVTLDLDFPDALPPVLGDPSQLRQVVMNLLTNASDAIGPRPGRIRVAAGTQQVDAAMADASATDAEGPLTQGPYVWMTVQDDGAGMDEATMARIFEPFFSTKFTGRGLGLAAVQGIVRSHHGRIHVTSQQGIGTTFSVLLPAAPPQESAAHVPTSTAAPARPLRPVAGATGTVVLVVDDERTVREVARAALETAGFTVQLASSGEEAVAEVRETGDRIGLVMLDLTLPGMSGRRVFDELRALRPTLPVLLTSGYSADEAGDLVAQAGVAFIAKPWRPQRLVEEAQRLAASVIRSRVGDGHEPPPDPP